MCLAIALFFFLFLELDELIFYVVFEFLNDLFLMASINVGCTHLELAVVPVRLGDVIHVQDTEVITNK